MFFSFFINSENNNLILSNFGYKITCFFEEGISYFLNTFKGAYLTIVYLLFFNGVIYVYERLFSY